MSNKIDFKIFTLPNYGVISTKLGDEDMKYLWNAIEEGKKANINMDGNAGHISSSLAIKDKDNRILDYACTLIHEYEKELGIADKKPDSFNYSLDSFWVNFQKQTEFNSMHNHSGVYSFVIWMKIPTEWTEQKELPISKNSTTSDPISNFAFVYTDTLGAIQNFWIKMGKDKEGILLLFPSQMQHLVNPFFNCDEERISISGNIYLNLEQKYDKRKF